MRIQHNIAALNAHRQLGINNQGSSAALEKLSSGFRINRAADDAAGLAISEKMRAQVRGLTQATRNAQDGISLIQTAEGATQEIHSMLQRMRELADQSATGTLTPEDRTEIQAEVDQLSAEITRIASDTEFNTMELLNGKMADGTAFHVGANSGQQIDLAIGDLRSQALGVAGNEAATIEVEAKASGVTNSALGDGTHEYSVVKLETTVTVGENGTGGDNSAPSIDAQYALVDSDGKAVAVAAAESNGEHKYHILDKATAIDQLGTETGLVTDTDKTLDFALPVTMGTVEITVSDDNAVTATAQGTLQETPGLGAGTYEIVKLENVTSTSYGEYKYGLQDSNGNIVALGADESGAASDLSGVTHWVNPEKLNESLLSKPEGTNGFAFSEDNEITITGAGIDISTAEAADKALDTIQTAIDMVSRERSNLGAVQNRLEYTIANLGVTAENLTAAESRIRDVDMPNEIMEFTKFNILNQASIAMLAQANMQPQAVLQLLG